MCGAKPACYCFEVRFIQKLVRLCKQLAPTWFITTYPLDPNLKRLANRINPVNFGRACVLTEFMSQISMNFEFGSNT